MAVKVTPRPPMPPLVGWPEVLAVVLTVAMVLGVWALS